MHFEMNAMHDDRKKGSLRSVTTYISEFYYFMTSMHVVVVEKKRKKIIRKKFSLISSQPTPLIWQFNMPL